MNEISFCLSDMNFLLSKSISHSVQILLLLASCFPREDFAWDDRRKRFESKRREDSIGVFGVLEDLHHEECEMKMLGRVMIMELMMEMMMIMMDTIMVQTGGIVSSGDDDDDDDFDVESGCDTYRLSFRNVVFSVSVKSFQFEGQEF